MVAKSGKLIIESLIGVFDQLWDSIYWHSFDWRWDFLSQQRLAWLIGHFSSLVITLVIVEIDVSRLSIYPQKPSSPLSWTGIQKE